MACFAFQTSITGIPAMIELGSSIAELLTCMPDRHSQYCIAQEEWHKDQGSLSCCVCDLLTRCEKIQQVQDSPCRWRR